MSGKALIVSSLIVLLIVSVREASGSDCGKVELSIPNIVKGTAIERGAWPFLAALHHVEQAKFFCGGTLISSKTVLTAAHCVQQKGSIKKLEPADVVVQLGAHNLDLKTETGTERREVEEICLHPDWKAFNDKYDADLAILVLREIVEFTKYIRPVRLPSDDPPIDAKGSIVGWGLSEKSLANMLEHESIPRQAYVRILNDSYCYTNQHLLAAISSTRLFCGGGEGGSPNSGDSGGGLFVPSGSTWTQYGIVSASLADDKGSVLLDSASLYTNVRAFKSWIDETIVKYEDDDMMTLGEMEKVKINIWCNYEKPLKTIYKCSAWDVNVTSENSEVDSITGTHLTGYDADKVNEVWFWTGTLEYIPDGIGEKLKYLETLKVGYADRNLGLRRLQRSNFKNMESLMYLDFQFNNVETIYEDTLWDLPNLKSFIIKNNKLKVLHGDTFARNIKLKLVNAESNQLESLPYDLFKNNPLLEEVFFNDNNLKTISTNFTHLSSIKSIDFHGNICIDKALEDVNSTMEFETILNVECSEKE